MPKMRRKADLPEKPCRQCGRPMVWRKAWARTWDDVLYCSDRCRAEAKQARHSPPQLDETARSDGMIEGKRSR